jgi:hypothetical protein
VDDGVLFQQVTMGFSTTDRRRFLQEIAEGAEAGIASKIKIKFKSKTDKGAGKFYTEVEDPRFFTLSPLRERRRNAEGLRYVPHFRCKGSAR